MITMPNAAKLNSRLVAKFTSLKSTLSSLVLPSLNNEIMKHENRHITNTRLTRSMKGKSGQNNLSTIEKTAEPIAADNAPSDVVFDQNIPITKITTIPGVKKPVNS